jgi:hypothetical protein
LGGPKLFAVAADNKRRLPLPFLLLIFVLTHNWVPTTGLTVLVDANEREHADQISSGLLRDKPPGSVKDTSALQNLPFFLSGRSHTQLPAGKPLLRGSICLSKFQVQTSRRAVQRAG